MKWNLPWIANKISIGAAGLALGLFMGGRTEAASFWLLLAIYLDGRLFLFK
jgi:hypothetical protein